MGLTDAVRGEVSAMTRNVEATTAAQPNELAQVLSRVSRELEVRSTGGRSLPRNPAMRSCASATNSRSRWVKARAWTRSGRSRR